MVFYRTEGFTGYSVEFSPFEESRLACAASQHFGIVGNGRQYVLNVDESGNVSSSLYFDSRDGLYDCTWSEENEFNLISASGDGSLKLWDLGLAGGGAVDNLGGIQGAPPIRSYEEHSHEVFCVDWNLITKENFVTGSWDDSIKLWDPQESHSLHTYNEHRYCIYSTIWSANDCRFASASGDYTFKVWDVNESHSVMTIQAHDYEILTCDWHKYNENIVATGSVDKTIKIWDLRTVSQGGGSGVNAQQPKPICAPFRGHAYAVRRLKFSPHVENILVSCSYDMTLNVWDIDRQDPLIQKCKHHSEFVVGVDFNIFREGQLASCSWDEAIAVWQLGTDPLMA